MDFAFSPKVEELRRRLLDFMDARVYPAEPVYAEQVAASGTPYYHAPIIEELKAEAHSQGLWNLFYPTGNGAPG
jgi:acyl-CoA dehydrogenase